MEGRYNYRKLLKFMSLSHDCHVIPPGLEELAACPNVYCKVSGVFCTDSNWNQTSVEGVVKPCLDIFGIERQEQLYWLDCVTL